MALAAAARVALTAWLCLLISGASGQSPTNVLPQGGALGGSNAELRLGNVYSLVMQDDCNLVLTHHGVGPLWDSGTAGRGNDCFFILQADGNGVIYKDNSFRSPVWSTETCCRADGEHYIKIQPDGNVCMYNFISPQALWATNTAGR